MKSGGASEYSNAVTATAVNARPAAPQWVYAYAIAGDALEAYWDVPQAYWDGTSSITGWRVEKSTYPFTTWTTVTTANQWYYDDYGLDPYETVCYQITALSDSYGNSEPSPSLGCATPNDFYYYGCEPCYCEECFGANSIGISQRSSGLSAKLSAKTPLKNFDLLRAALANPRVKQVNTLRVAPITQSRRKP
jgi:hypothetical protein